MANEPTKPAAPLSRRVKHTGSDAPGGVGVPVKAAAEQSTTQAVDIIPSTKGERIMEQVGSHPILNGVKAAGEALVVPGASLILDGNVKSSAVHMLGAVVARALVGPVGWIYFAADSYSVSVSGKNLHEHFISK